jgi:hypothetical protein
MRLARPGKKPKSVREILLQTDLAFCVHVFQEFYVEATRQSGARVNPEIAVRLITSWTHFPVQQMTLDLYLRVAIHGFCDQFE